MLWLLFFDPYLAWLPTFWGRIIFSSLTVESAPVRGFVRSTYFVSIPLLLMMLSIPCVPQSSRQSAPRPNPGVGPPITDADQARDRLERDMEKKALKERVAALKNDTDKLLRLSVELKAYVDKSDENVLSLDVIKKADEIEKLAHSVKDKMKGSN